MDEPGIALPEAAPGAIAERSTEGNKLSGVLYQESSAISGKHRRALTTDVQKHLPASHTTKFQ